jgi:hypothetical protein
MGSRTGVACEARYGKLVARMERSDMRERRRNRNVESRISLPLNPGYFLSCAFCPLKAPCLAYSAFFLPNVHQPRDGGVKFSFVLQRLPKAFSQFNQHHTYIVR